MKLLKIENDKGHFLKAENEYIPVDQLSKDDLLKLVSLTLEEEVEFDDYDGDAIKNQAHQIIYKNVFEKLSALHARKDEFFDESERLYLADYERYKEESLGEPD
jgi:hypothetical protein